MLRQSVLLIPGTDNLKRYNYGPKLQSLISGNISRNFPKPGICTCHTRVFTKHVSKIFSLKTTTQFSHGFGYSVLLPPLKQP